MFEHFTDRAIAVVMLSQEEARRLNQSSVGTEQLLLGLLREQTSLAAQALVAMGVTLEKSRQLVGHWVGKGPGTAPVEIPFTPKTRQVLEQALQEARQRQQRFVGPEHILLGMLHIPGILAIQMLLQMGVNLADLELALTNEMEQPVEAIAGSGSLPSRDTEPQGRPRLKALEMFGTNLTQLAAAGQLDPVVGRHQETERVIQILSRRSKNNPLLLGEPGVGKTAIAEGLAQRIAYGDVPEGLRQAQVISLDLAGLVAGTRFRGEFEERLTQILEEIRSAKNVILMIDEVHTLLGAGLMGGGGADAANLLKPALARGELQCLGATTLEEYRKYIEQDAALERRFQPVRVGEPSVAETVQILTGLRSAYERHHRLTITDAALQTAAALSDRYITDRFLPDKAIDLLDEAASRVQLQEVNNKKHQNRVKEKKRKRNNGNKEMK